ncbi:hypothetical protein F5H01DRAFT_415603 [Linnemannia elongata]|nr:hypothetical protein F5H01DRAFT_415603 [Linnemannia elongata]
MTFLRAMEMTVNKRVEEKLVARVEEEMEARVEELAARVEKKLAGQSKELYPPARAEEATNHTPSKKKDLSPPECTTSPPSSPMASCHPMHLEQTLALPYWGVIETDTEAHPLERSPPFMKSQTFGDTDDCMNDSDEEKKTLSKNRYCTNGLIAPEMDGSSGRSPDLEHTSLDCSPSDVAETPTMVHFTPVYDHQSCYEYPNGDVVGTIDVLPMELDGEVAVESIDGVMKPNSETFKVMLKNDIRTHKLVKEGLLEEVKIARRLCFGVYRCPHCAYSDRPRIPQNGKKNSNTVPLPPKSKCFTHKCELVWHRCTASMVSLFYHGRLKAEVHHVGIHNHEKPPPWRADVISKRAFDQRVVAAPERTPDKLTIGNGLQGPVGDLHGAYHHVGRIARERHILLGKTKTTATMASFLGLEKTLGIEFFGSPSFRAKNGHITLQTRFMRETLAKRQSCLQSDSVHGMIKDPQYGADIYVSFTSGYCAALERAIPLVTILFERSGFELALREHCTFPDGQSPSLSGIYRFCEVHCKRSVSRAVKSHSFVPPVKKDRLKDLTLKLLEPQDQNSFMTTLENLLEYFPKVKNWLNWYLNDQRGPLIFPALSMADCSRLARDTNSQESIGAEFKKLIPVETGSKNRLSDPKTPSYLNKKSSNYLNDGRAPTPDAPDLKTYRELFSKEPDSIGQLLQPALSQPLPPPLSQPSPPPLSQPFQSPSPLSQLVPPPPSPTLPHPPLFKDSPPAKRSHRVGRPRGMPNTKPKLNIDCKTFGIPWGVKRSFFRAVNTCPLSPGYDFDVVLPGLFRLVKRETSQCHSPTCPNPVRVKRKKLAQVNTSTRGQVTQAVVHAAVMRSSLEKSEDLDFTSEPCDVEMDASVTIGLYEGFLEATMERHRRRQEYTGAMDLLLRDAGCGHLYPWKFLLFQIF